MTLKSVERDEAQEEKERAQAETMYRSEEIGEAPLHMPLPVPDAKVRACTGQDHDFFLEAGSPFVTSKLLLYRRGLHV